MDALAADTIAFSGKKVGVVVLSLHDLTGKRIANALTSSRQLAIEVLHVNAIESVAGFVAENRASAVVAEFDLMSSHGLRHVRDVVDAIAPIPLLAISTLPELTVARDVLALGAQEYLCLSDLDREDIGRCVRHAVERQVLHSRLVERLSELERTKMRFQSLIADNADALVIVTDDGTIQFANPAAETLLQQSVSELVGSNLGMSIDSQDEVEIELVARDRRRMTLSARPMRTLWEGERAHIVSLRDITDRKSAVQALERAKQYAEESSKAKSQFLANMSHELRTPLNSIIGFSEMIGLETFGDLGHPQYRGYAENIRLAGSHLLDLINDLLDLSKVEAGRLELEESQFDPVAAAEEIVMSLKPNADEAGLKVSVSSQLDGIKLYADKRKIKQVLFNLLSNAIKFTPAGGQITIDHGTDNGGSLVISVTDTGIGIPKDQIPKALEAFGQIRDSYTRKTSDGTGLGLALSKELVELHGGILQIRTKVKKGTTVSVVLPQERTNLTRRADPRVRHSSSRLLEPLSGRKKLSRAAR